MLAASNVLRIDHLEMAAALESDEQYEARDRCGGADGKEQRPAGVLRDVACGRRQIRAADRGERGQQRVLRRGVQRVAAQRAQIGDIVAFTGIRFRIPAASNFVFMPPEGVEIRSTPSTTPEPGGVVDGSGWTSVQTYPDVATPLERRQSTATGSTFAQVSGAWGTGSLFESDLLSLLVTKDGVVYVGSVDPSVLYTAAGK